MTGVVMGARLGLAMGLAVATALLDARRFAKFPMNDPGWMVVAAMLSGARR